jgi:hypothetical protein
MRMSGGNQGRLRRAYALERVWRLSGGMRGVHRARARIFPQCATQRAGTHQMSRNQGEPRHCPGRGRRSSRGGKMRRRLSSSLQVPPDEAGTLARRADHRERSLSSVLGSPMNTRTYKGVRCQQRRDAVQGYTCERAGSVRRHQRKGVRESVYFCTACNVPNGSASCAAECTPTRAS